jgi:acetyl-CoA synthetase
MKPGRDFWWHELMAEASAECPAEPLDSENSAVHPLHQRFHRQTQRHPHTTAGYNLYTRRLSSGCSITARTTSSGARPTAVGSPVTATSSTARCQPEPPCLMYEGAPNWPAEDRFWEIIEKYKVTILYTAPTAIRAFIKWGDQHVDKHDLSSLRLLGTVGEGINPEAWMWYHRKIGGERCPIVDTWWQTETGGIMMSPCPAPSHQAGQLHQAAAGRDAGVDSKGIRSNPGTAVGWSSRSRGPGMLRGIWGDDERYRDQYWSRVPHKYLAGDNARRDDDGYYWIMGRIDDVINVSGHRLSTIEIESALVSHPKVAEAAAVGRADELKGQAISVFVTLTEGEPSEALRNELRQHVRHEIGALAQPDDIHFTNALPKTRSGKIMRRLLKDIAEGRESVGDTTTLEDYTVLAKLRQEEV